ncbi:MAG TPA: DUF4845 domain-containing protein [Steroidobacteraceae bacterium]|nr:DUF4845 domain-containing protein [Steroidobacteraceae bacterium]
MLHRQRGMTFIGTLIIFALVGAIAYGGIRLTPVYLNYMKIARTMDTVASEFKDNGGDESAIRNSLEKHWEIEDISVVDSTDVELHKGDGGLAMHIAYDDKVPYIGDVSLDVSFDKTVTIQQ